MQVVGNADNVSTQDTEYEKGVGTTLVAVDIPFLPYLQTVLSRASDTYGYS